MPKLETIADIVRGSEAYFRLFALAEGMARHEGCVEWIAPKAGFDGPAITYRVALPREAEAELERLLPGLQSGAVPPLWVLSPLSTPQNAAELLLAKGFKELSKPEHPEYGMAAELAAFADAPAANPRIKVRKVATLPEFQTWMQVVNTALHGWELLTIERYAVWLAHGAFSFYLGLLDGEPVSTAATIARDGMATLEFVSTLPEQQRQGAGLAVCRQALLDLRKKRIETVTLRTSPEGYRLYRKLGFASFYTQRLFAFQNEKKDSGNDETQT